MVEYRSFRNGDPPAILSLWHRANLGRGAAVGIGNDAFDLINYSQPFFDPAGVIFAFEGGRPAGFVHAGFASQEDQLSLDHSCGVVSAVVVDPEFRKQGLGRELLRRAEAYLRERGAADVTAGGDRGRDPFFFGLYGGSRPSGFLESDPAASPFLTACGYEPASRHGVYQRDLTLGRDPTNFRIVSIRRKAELQVTDAPDNVTWWWSTHQGRLDSVRFHLTPRISGGETMAAVTVVGLDVYMPAWQERAVGLNDLWVREDLRGKGYGQTLVIEVVRRLRQELVTRAEIHVTEGDAAMTDVVNACGFERVDTGVVYRRTS